MREIVRWGRRIVVVGALALLAPGCANSTEYVRPRRVGGADPREGRDERILEVLTYNVAGLPEFVSHVGPKRKHPYIGPKLTPYDLVLVQEDFWYHHLLHAPHTWQTTARPAPLLQLGDGLARFSWRPLGRVEHVPWKAAHGVLEHSNDELAAKGFSLGTIEVLPGHELPVYDLHCDAGRHDGDRKARRRQFRQLIAHIREHVGPDDALIVAGDFNCHPAEFEDLLVEARLRDAHADAGENGGIDRILYRSGERLRLRALECGDAAGFTHEGERLSDHVPVRARFALEPLCP